MIYIIYSRKFDKERFTFIETTIGWIDSDKYPIDQCIKDLEIKFKLNPLEKYPYFYADSLKELTRQS